jgi:hypothetical protein
MERRGSNVVRILKVLEHSSLEACRDPMPTRDRTLHIERLEDKMRRVFSSALSDFQEADSQSGDKRYEDTIDDVAIQLYALEFFVKDDRFIEHMSLECARDTLKAYLEFFGNSSSPKAREATSLMDEIKAAEKRFFKEGSEAERIAEKCDGMMPRNLLVPAREIFSH